ncbi:hypothetical protein F4809DRAFT_655427 [Biscogniauxia mediterranea]|nr:hypothetical protein F4809DRAFT_655427 [Biscogniauxia mediterranea]
MAILSVFLWGCLLLPLTVARQSGYSLFRNYLVARGTGPRWWGSDSLTWRPSRFIKPGGTEYTPQGEGKSAREEEFVHPRRGTFVGWSECARDCPGRKFSQVEFVATIASLFRDWRVDPVTFEGEVIEAARERVLDLIKTDSAIVLLQKMIHHEKAPLVWSRR